MSKKKIKKFIFPGLSLIASIYASIAFAAGAVVGFFATEVFMKKYVHSGKIKSLKLNLKDWEIQLHHWLWPGLLIIGTYFLGYINIVPISLIGFASGIMFQDLYRDKKWHRVVYKKQPR